MEESEIVIGEVIDYNERGEVKILARYDNPERFIKRKYSKVLVAMSDSRKASPEQIKKAHALINEIAEWSGEASEGIKRCLKLKFITQQQNEVFSRLFSFSNCDMTIAREFISYLIDFILEWDVPTKRPLSELCDDIKKYIYACLKHKKCAVCGRRAELHHIDAVGMGRDREEIPHEGMEAISLCGGVNGHHAEWHTLGQATFDAKYHFKGGIKLDADLCKIYKLKRGKKNE